MPTFALIIWPIVSIAIFAGLGPQRGLIWSVVIGYLFLPDGYQLNPPGLPSYSKETAIAIGALFGTLITAGRLSAERPVADRTVVWMFGGLLALILIGPFLTTMVNRAPVFFGPTVRQGMTLWDVQTHLVPLMVGLVPWFLARRYLNTPEMHREILAAIVAVGLFYSLLALYELRMSPQLNNMLYGYFPHFWGQHLRSGGYRPLVFLDHGLSLGYFLMTVVLAATALVMASTKEKRAFYIVAASWMMLVLTVSRNLGALALALLFVPPILLLSRRLQLRIAVLAAVFFLVNPLIRDIYVEPTLALAQSVSQHRHDSLKTRFDNEQALLDRVNQKPITGWGSWSRWRVHDESGRDITISDGTWIIVLGKWGWLGYLGFFGMLGLPILLASRAARRRSITTATTGLALMTAANLIYLIPNSTLSPVAWLAAGALAGFAQFVPAANSSTQGAPQAPATPVPGEGKTAYTRFAQGAGTNRKLSRY